MSSLVSAQDDAPNSVYVGSAEKFIIDVDFGITALDSGDLVTWVGDNATIQNLTLGTDAFTSLQEAIDSVSENGTVYIANGIYDEGAELIIDKALTLQGDGANLTTLSGNSNGDEILDADEHRILNIDGVSGNIMINDLSFLNGIAAIDVTDGDDGGAIFFNGENLTIERCSFSRNLASDDGGAIYYEKYFFAQSSTLTIIGCDISQNSASDGGGVYLRTGNGIISDSVFLANTSGSSGGAIYQFSATLDLLGVELKENLAAESGGGIYSRSDLTLNHVDFVENEASSAGGGLYNFSNTSDINHVIFSSNIADSEGGGLVNRGDLTGSYITFTENAVLDGDGGGLSNRDAFIANNVSFVGNSVVDGDGGGFSNRDEMTLSNLTVINNTALFSDPKPFGATGDGGGIANNSSFGVLTVTGANISGNTASEEGGGVYNFFGSVTMSNTLISNNVADLEGGGMSISGVLLDLTNCIISGNTAGDDGGGIITSSDTINLDHCTITNNTSAEDGGGVRFNGGSNEIKIVQNTVIAGNFDDSSSGLRVDTYGDYSGSGVNFIGVENTSDDGFRSDVDLSFATTSATSVNDLFTSLSDNGGPYSSHAVVLNSPLIDAADSEGLINDFRGEGFVREYGAGVDIGALEFSNKGAEPQLYIKEAIPGEDVLLEAVLVPGQRYALEYSDDLSGFTRMPFTLTAESNFYQLRDIGSPFTPTPSSVSPKRFYRLVLNPTE